MEYLTDIQITNIITLGGFALILIIGWITLSNWDE